jgi:putative peptide zinc metalloprotease protein
MAMTRPTFHESWYRVAGLKLHIRSAVEVTRQHYRGQVWYVLRDPGNNDYFRVNEVGYRFVGLLNGQRTIDDVWRNCLEHLGDDAPTQGEVVQLLGKLFVSNLLRGDLPPDSEGLLKRFQKRRMREVGGYLSNLLFIRIPLFDPDPLLEKIEPLLGWFFSKVGFVLWVVLLGFGFNSLSGRWDSLFDQAENVLDPSNLGWMYLCFALVKGAHELGHGLACKHFGRSEGGGEVHTLGLMLLIFTPMPYVDATSSWSFRSKFRRMTVAAGGMYIELAIAAVAAMLWSSSASGTMLHALSYNVMFIASVTTLLFNVNPLLRYDGYYILSDFLELPNLAMRSKQYLYYVVRRLWGVKGLSSPAHSRGERIWFIPYCLGSFCYRVIICSSILMFIGQKFFPIAVLMGGMAVVTWVLKPLWQFGRYLLTSSELIRTRPWAIGSTGVILLAVIGLLGFRPMPDRFCVQGITESVEMVGIYAGCDGELTTFLPTDRQILPGESLAMLTNPSLEAEAAGLAAQQREWKLKRYMAMQENETAKMQMCQARLDAITQHRQRIQRDLDRRKTQSPIAGLWVSPQLDRWGGKWITRGEQLGMVIPKGTVRFRVVISQNEAARLFSLSKQPTIEYRPLGSGSILPGKAHIEKLVQAGREQLPSASLGFRGGGGTAVDMSDPKGLKTSSHFFEAWIVPDSSGPVLRPGQRVVCRIELPAKPLLQQWWRKTLQLFQTRFRS